MHTSVADIVLVLDAMHTTVTRLWVCFTVRHLLYVHWYTVTSQVIMQTRSNTPVH